MPKVLVDGKQVEVAEGASALDALRTAGLDVPTACYDPRLKPSGACRLCLVRVKGTSRPVTSCALKVTDGMELEVESPEMHEARRAELEMLARTYPSEYIDQLPEKRFHTWLKAYGLSDPSPAGGGRVCERIANRGGGGIDDTNPYFRFDPAACIKCFACVQICDELQGSFVWQVMGRGADTHVMPDSLGTIAQSSCKTCGACADACPTAALVDKTRLEMGQADTWTRTTCPYCGVGCELHAGVKDGRLVQALPVLESPVSKGHLCVKGRYAHQFVHSPDRVLTPLIRRNGTLEPATWDEAVRLVADNFKRIADEHGPDSIGVLGSARATNEDNYMAQKFARAVLGTNNVDCCARVCHGPTAAAMKATLGTGAATNSFDDVEETRAIMVVGCNPTENHPIMGDRILQSVLKGAKLIVIDPRRIELANYADIHMQLRPGGNVPLLNAMAHVIFDEGLADERFLTSRTSEADEFRQFLLDKTPEWAAPFCGVEPDLIRQAARLYASTKPAMCFHGLGMTEHLQGTEGVMALVNLALITGNIGKPGAGINPLRGQNNVQGSAHMGCEPSNLTGYVSIADNRQRFEKVWHASIPEHKGLNLMEMLDAALDGRFKALWAVGYDVYFTNASASHTRKQFEALDFVVVQDLFLNETAKEFAHVFLPACSSFEHDGTFMNAERRVNRVRKAVEPVGESKADWEITQLIAQAMGHPEGFSFANAEEIWEEIRQVWLPGAGMSYARLEHAGLQWPCTSEDHPGTRILHRESFPIGAAVLKRIEYTPTDEQTSDEFPFLLTTGRTLYQFNAGTMTGRTRNKELRPSDTLDMHPSDAGMLGLTAGERVRITSRHGSAEMPLRVDVRVKAGELFATFHTPEVFINLATSKVRDRTVGTPEYKVTAVRVEHAV